MRFALRIKEESVLCLGLDEDLARNGQRIEQDNICVCISLLHGGIRACPYIFSTIEFLYVPCLTSVAR